MTLHFGMAIANLTCFVDAIFVDAIFVKYLNALIGARLSGPNTCGVNGKLSIYIYICLFVWYVRIPYMHSALFVRDAIFPHVCMHS